MNNVDLLTAQVETCPDNPIVASMLIDELMDVRDMNRSEAEGHVLRVQQVAVDAAFMRRAAEILSGCPWQRCWARDRVLDAVGAPEGTTAVLMLIPGLQHPRVHVPTSMSVGAVWAEGTITIGAQWLFREYREYLAWMREHKRELRAARKAK